MARNGSGTYNLLTNSWNPATNGVSATAVDWQNLINDVAAALTQSLSADGQTPMTGNLNAGNNKITGLAAGSATGNSLRWEQLFSQGQPVTLASAATTDIGAQNTVLLNITGTTTITSFGTNYNGPRYLRFDGILTLTHNATTLILPGGVNITTAAGDSAIVVPNGTPSNGWRVVGYQRGNGTLPFQNSVNTANIADAQITPAKLSTGAPTWDVSNNFTVNGSLGVGANPTNKLDVYGALGAVLANFQENTSGQNRRIRHSITSNVITIESTASTGNTNLAFAVDGSERGRYDNNGNHYFNSGYGSVAIAYGCRAWVNFNGTGTVAIRASGNVSSITDNGTGDYTVNFTTAMPDTSYAIAGTSSSSDPDGAWAIRVNTNTSLTTTAVRILNGGGGGSVADPLICSVVIFR
jgi:hypothetical protein